ncbi:mitochondrial dynamin GTPase Msp1 [Dimargaris xerosporica]|nr:mitochondrial dynamin GTPase Msp1 [Dimargaris xerosporica]
MLSVALTRLRVRPWSRIPLAPRPLLASYHWRRPAAQPWTTLPTQLRAPVTWSTQQTRQVSFIFRQLVPKVATHLFRVPLTVVGVGAGAATYVNYKINQVTDSLAPPDWLVSAWSTAKEWTQQQQQAVTGPNDWQVPEWIQQLFAHNANTAPPLGQATTNMFGVPPGHHHSSDGGSSGASSGGAAPSPSSSASPSYSASALDNDDRDSYSTTFRAPSAANPNGHGSEFTHFIKTLIQVQNVLKTVDFQHRALQFPNIVVIGSQSSGKSSVLEAIVGHQFLPKGSNMVTRRPIELTLVHTPDSTEQYGEFPDLGLGKIHDFTQIQKTLTDLNLAVPESECVSDQPIDLRIYSPNIPDLKLVDLPGYIQVHTRNQPTVLKQRIRGLCERYIQAPNIILAVCAADVDLANSEALLASRRADPLGLRTIGVVTKMDTVEPEVGRAILLNRDYPLQLGYIGVVCKPVDKRAHQPSLASRLAKRAARGDDGASTMTEGQYYQLYPAYQDHQLQLGVPTLRTKLVAILEQHMGENLQSIVEAVQTELDEARYQFKVHYSDQRISAQSYVMDSLDHLKHQFKELTARFGKDDIRESIRRLLDERVMELCAELYWDDPRVKELAAMSPSVLKSLPAMHNYYQVSPAASLSADALAGQPLYWQRKLERSQSLLTKSGVGRWSTHLIADTLLTNLQAMVNAKPFQYHPLAQRVILQFSEEMLRSRYLATVEQVENTLKPLKYEVECTDNEWRDARAQSTTNLQREIALCEQQLRSLKEQVGRDKLQSVLKYLAEQTTAIAHNQGPKPSPDDHSGPRPMTTSAPSMLVVPDSPPMTDASHKDSNSPPAATTETTPSSATAVEPKIIDLDEPAASQQPSVVYSQRLVNVARQVLYLRQRHLVLRYRLAAVKSRTCKYQDHRVLCPEVFLHMLATKLAHNAVLFIQVELLNEFFFQFPRELDNRLYYGLNQQQIRDFARENPTIVEQLDLADRKAKLEDVLQTLLNITHNQRGGNGNGNGAAGAGPSSALFNAYPPNYYTGPLSSLPPLSGGGSTARPYSGGSN